MPRSREHVRSGPFGTARRIRRARTVAWAGRLDRSRPVLGAVRRWQAQVAGDAPVPECMPHPSARQSAVGTRAVVMMWAQCPTQTPRKTRRWCTPGPAASHSRRCSRTTASSTRTSSRRHCEIARAPRDVRDARSRLGGPTGAIPFTVLPLAWARVVPRHVGVQRRLASCVRLQQRPWHP